MLRLSSFVAGLAIIAVAALPSPAAALLAPGSPLKEDFVLGPTTPGKWGGGAMGTSGGTVTWSLMPTGTSCASEFSGCVVSALASFLPGGFLAQIQAAFNAWSAVANISFLQVADDGAAFNATTASGDIRLGGHAFDGPSGTLAHGYYPPANGGSAAGDIHFDVAETWKIGFGGPGVDVYQVMAHEIGHALGLEHTGVAGSLMNPFYTEGFAGPQSDDIAGIQFIYGAAETVVDTPEPASLAVLVAGLAGLGMARRRGARSRR